MSESTKKPTLKELGYDKCIYLNGADNEESWVQKANSSYSYDAWTDSGVYSDECIMIQLDFKKYEATKFYGVRTDLFCKEVPLAFTLAELEAVIEILQKEKQKRG